MKTDIHEMTLAFRAGEERGFNFFYNKYHKALVYYAFGITKDEAIAKDAAIVAFERIWKENPGIFTHHRVIARWLYVTTKNYCYNLYKVEQRENGHHDRIFKELEGTDVGDLDRELIKAETIRELREHINKLPRACREIVILYSVGYNSGEISRALDLSSSTVKNQLARGIEYLKGYFNGWERAKFYGGLTGSTRRVSTTSGRNKAIIDAYIQGDSVQVLVDRFQLSYERVATITFPTRERLKKERNEKIIAAVQEKQSYRVVAAKFNLTAATVSHIMSAHKKNLKDANKSKVHRTSDGLSLCH